MSISTSFYMYGVLISSLSVQKKGSSKVSLSPEVHFYLDVSNNILSLVVVTLS